MRIVITINDPPPEFDRCSLLLESPDLSLRTFVTIARLTDGTWSVISHAPFYPPNWSPSKPVPAVTVDVKR